MTPKQPAPKQVAPGASVAVARGATLSSLIADRDVRKAPAFADLLMDCSVREGGWSVRELLRVASSKVDEAERSAKALRGQVKDLEGRLDAANRNVDAWREHSERVARPYASTTEHRDREYSSRPNTDDARASDPYTPEAKRTRYAYDERDPGPYRRPYGSRAPTRSGARPSTPPVTGNAAPSSYPRDPYAHDPYASQNRSYR